MKYQINDIVLGEVSGIKPYGAFVKLANGESGLIHISEISSLFVKNIEDFVKVGQQVRLKVIEIIPEKNVYRLSLKEVEPRARQNIRQPNRRGVKRMYHSNEANFTPLKENLENWISQELSKIKENKND